MKDETLFDKAHQNYIVARSLMSTLGNDEVYLNYIGYHLQQAVELAIKFELEQNGINYPKIHDIDQLLMLANENKVKLVVSKYILEHNEMFTLWEYKTKYVLNYRLSKLKINNALKEVEYYLMLVKDEYNCM